MKLKYSILSLILELRRASSVTINAAVSRSLLGQSSYTATTVIINMSGRKLEKKKRHNYLTLSFILLIAIVILPQLFTNSSLSDYTSYYGTIIGTGMIGGSHQDQKDDASLTTTFYKNNMFPRSQEWYDHSNGLTNPKRDRIQSVMIIFVMIL